MRSECVGTGRASEWSEASERCISSRDTSQHLCYSTARLLQVSRSAARGSCQPDGRLRAQLYRKTYCTFCKVSAAKFSQRWLADPPTLQTDLPNLLFTSSPDTPFPLASPADIPPGAPPGSLDLTKFQHSDAKLGVVFEDADMVSPVDSNEGNRHLPGRPRADGRYFASPAIQLPEPDMLVHGSRLGRAGEAHACDPRDCSVVRAISPPLSCPPPDSSPARSGLCRRQLSRFAHEQVLYPPHLLALHDPSQLKRGQRKPIPRGKAEDELVATWGEPHPMCEVSTGRAPGGSSR